MQTKCIVNQLNNYINSNKLVSITTTGLCTLLSVLSLTLSLKGLSGNLLSHISALLSTSCGTFSGSNIWALLIIDIFGHWSRSAITNLLWHIIANLTGLIDIIADLKQLKYLSRIFVKNTQFLLLFSPFLKHKQSFKWLQILKDLTTIFPKRVRLVHVDVCCGGPKS